MLMLASEEGRTGEVGEVPFVGVDNPLSGCFGRWKSWGVLEQSGVIALELESLRG